MTTGPADRSASGAGPVSLSAVAIMRNEALNLPGLIANLVSWVDELVLVDDGSTDVGPEIARAAGPTVRLVPHRMDPATGYAGQRNAGLAAARGDWILHMDCDERVSLPLAREILGTLPNAMVNAFRYRRLNYFLHRPMRRGGWGGWNKPQIARRGKHRFEGALHERCIIEGGEAAIGQFNAPMHHLNDPDFAYRLEKSARYVQMELEKARRAGRMTSGWRLARVTAAEFLKRYVVKGGCLDGTPGLISAFHAATSVFRVEALLWDENNLIGRADLERCVGADLTGEALREPDWRPAELARIPNVQLEQTHDA